LHRVQSPAPARRAVLSNNPGPTYRFRVQRRNPAARSAKPFFSAISAASAISALRLSCVQPAHVHPAAPTPRRPRSRRRAAGTPALTQRTQRSQRSQRRQGHGASRKAPPGVPPGRRLRPGPSRAAPLRRGGLVMIDELPGRTLSLDPTTRHAGACRYPRLFTCYTETNKQFQPQMHATASGKAACPRASNQ